MIVDPWGVVLATAPDKEIAIVADLDLALLDGVRRRFPSLANRRPQELYATPPGSSLTEVGPSLTAGRE